MGKETITSKQGVILLIMFIIGSTVILGAATEAKQDLWLALLIAIAGAVPVILMYSKILSLYPGMDLFQILKNVFGSVLGTIISVFYILFFIQSGSLALKNFSGFIHIIGLQETPEIVCAIIMGVLCIWVVKEGVEVLGRWTQFIFPVIALLVIFLVTLSFQRTDFNNLKPFLYNGFYPVYKGTLNSFIFPFTQIVVFLVILNNLKKVKSSYKVFILGLLIGGLVIFIISVRNILVLGPEYESTIYFATYEAVSLIHVSDFLQRFEAFVSVIFLFTGFTKISIFLYAASKGVERIFNLKDYRKIVAPIGLFLIITSSILFENYADFVEWIENINSYYALPFHVILPIIILVTAEVKTRLVKGKNNMQELPQKN